MVAKHRGGLVAPFHATTIFSQVSKTTSFLSSAHAGQNIVHIMCIRFFVFFPSVVVERPFPPRFKQFLRRVEGKRPCYTSDLFSRL